MTGGALAFVNGFAGGERAVGIADFDHADLLNALCQGLLRVGVAGSGLVGRRDIQDQANDGDDRNHKRRKYRDQ
ncbi:hypothetical protein D3C87_1819840 [compost metagenome]